MEAVRIIREMREATNGRYPAFALWENVPGAFSSNKGEDFRTVLEELVKIVEPSAVMPPVPKNGWPYADCYMGDGWGLAYRVFDAQYWGVPQRRRRIHLVLHLTGQCAGQVLFEREGLRGHFAESGTTWQATAGDAANCTGTTDREGDGAGRGLDAVNAAGFKIRSGCEGGGKGALIQTDKSATLSTLNDQYLFQPVVYSRQRSDEFVENDVVSTQSARQHKDATDLIVDYLCFEPRSQDGVPRIHGDITPTLNTAQGGQRQPCVVHPNGVRYIVRRLTPTECARLQGFPDEWGHPVRKEELTEQEYAFWLNVRNTHAAINGKAVKEYTKDQMLAWYNKIHTDSAEYKMWGNGIALPPALYVMEGIAETERMMNCE